MRPASAICASPSFAHRMRPDSRLVFPEGLVKVTSALAGNQRDLGGHRLGTVGAVASATAFDGGRAGAVLSPATFGTAA